MKRFFLLIGLLLFVGTVSADVRVLIRFDASGHHVHRSFYTDSAPRSNAVTLKSDRNHARTAISRARSLVDASKRPSNMLRNSARAIPLLNNSEFVILRWFDAAGELLVETFTHDPRVAHSPAHVNGMHASRTAFRTGAWLAIGPSEATSFTVSLPENLSLDLGAEIWQLSLLP